MNVKTVKGLDIDIYHEELDNGLNVYLIPIKDRKNYYVEYITKYGAEVDEFISHITGKKVKAPYGVAHFLEHKMFEQETGIDPFSYYSQTGTEANASTGYKTTSYTLEGVNALEDNLDYLLNYVNSPYFTDENVEKEKGIIIEELNMYKDQPENVLYEASNKAVFKKHPVRRDIGGTPNSVKKITKEILYECYDTFYQPNNMLLIVAGNLDKDKIMNVIKSNKKLNDKKKSSEVKVFNVKEPIEVNKKEEQVKVKNMVLPKFVLTFKSPLSVSDNMDKYKQMAALDMLLYLIYGNSSEFRETTLEKQLYSLFYFSSALIDDFFVVEFIAESKYPEVFRDAIINELKTRKITEKDIERVKKVKVSLEVMETDKTYRLLDMVANHIIDYGDIIYDKMDIIRSITLKDVLSIRDKILIDNYSYTLGIPKK